LPDGQALGFLTPEAVENVNDNNAESSKNARPQHTKAKEGGNMISRLNHQLFKLLSSWGASCFLLLLFVCARVDAQADQGAITGVVEDSSGAAIANAQVTLTNTDTGLILQRETNASGVYVFSPVKIGNYQVSATAPGFQTTSQPNLHLDIQQRLNLNLTLKPGAVTETMTVSSEAPLLQTQESSVGQVISTDTINETGATGFTSRSSRPGLPRRLETRAAAAQVTSWLTASAPSKTTSCWTVWITTRT
jgi:Carboxypeptidase regulatory-like domain